MSLVWVSAIRTSALRFVGSATRTRFVPGLDLRAALDRNHLQHARHSGLHAQVVELPHAQLVRRALLVDVRFLRRHLRLEALFRHLEPLLGDLQPVLLVLRLCALQFDGQLGYQAILLQLLIRFEVQLGLTVVGFDRRRVRLLAQVWLSRSAFLFRNAA